MYGYVYRMLSGCELIDTENISLLSRLIFFSINHIHIQMTCLSNINTDTSIFVFSREKSMIQNIQNTLPQNIVHKFLQVYIIVKSVEFVL